MLIEKSVSYRELTVFKKTVSLDHIFFLLEVVMKSKRSLICLIVFITSIVISCSWQIPENISVKTKADYEFGDGRVEKSLVTLASRSRVSISEGLLPSLFTSIIARSGR